MLNRMHLIAATALCGLTLGLLPVHSAHAAGTALVVGQSDADPFVIGWVDSSKGTGTDKNVAQQFHDLFAGSTWTLTDDHVLTIARADGKVILQAAYVSDSKLTIATFHWSNGKTAINGDLWKNSDDPTKGAALFWISVPSQDGQSIASPRIFVNLTYGGGSNGGGGFNGF